MGTTSRFRVEPVDLSRTEDWDALFATYWESRKNPLQFIGILSHPWIGEGGHREMESYNAAKEGYLESARKTPNQRWLKIVDCDVPGAARIIGGGVFTIVPAAEGIDFSPISDRSIQQNLPDIKRPGLNYPFGSERNILMRQLFSQLWSLRPRIMRGRPHIYGQNFWTLPEYRKLGAGVAALDWWVEQADARSLEMFLEGSAMATPLYLQKGFVLVERPVMVFPHLPLDAETPPSNDWKRIVHRLMSEPVAIMWRPVKGEYQEGKTVLPWTGMPRTARL